MLKNILGILQKVKIGGWEMSDQQFNLLSKKFSD
jgi:hypothetical protein